ncbi:MAG TPA: zf-HC2 domain-containing protein [Candidatus Dormibacteraeota bacterium]|nr:zf-HC2 domain-containing protein [Candidatus Dormibacteraeota bacterium]
MNCKPMEALLLAVVDGRATAEERDRAGRHVAGCQACARRLEEMSATWSALEELPAVEPSAWFDTRLAARMRESQPKAGWLGRLPKGMRWIAVAAALAAMAIWISLRPPAGRPAPATSPQNQQDFAVIQNLPELENYDVISNFEALSALPGAQTVDHSQQME